MGLFSYDVSLFCDRVDLDHAKFSFDAISTEQFFTGATGTQLGGSAMGTPCKCWLSSSFH